MKTAWRWVSRLIAAGLAAYVLWFALRHLQLDSLAHAFERPAVPVALVFASLAYCLIYPLAGWAWQRLLRRQGVNERAWVLTRIIALTQLAKYVPGNIAQHASRAALSLKQGIAWTPYLATAWQEALLSVSASLLVGGGMAALSPLGWAGLPPQLGLFACVVAGATLLACLNWPARRMETSQSPLIKWLRKLGRPPGTATALMAITTYAVNYLAVGAGIWVLAAALGLAETVTFPLATAAFAFSWALGFLAPGAPAGLGAREGMMLLVLQGHGRSEDLLLLVLLTRVATLAGDLLSFLLAWWLPAASRMAAQNHPNGE